MDRRNLSVLPLLSVLNLLTVVIVELGQKTLPYRLALVPNVLRLYASRNQPTIHDLDKEIARPSPSLDTVCLVSRQVGRHGRVIEFHEAQQFDVVDVHESTVLRYARRTEYVPPKGSKENS